MAFILLKTNKQTKSDLNVEKRNKSFEIHLQLYGDPCNPRLVLLAFNKRYLCQNLFVHSCLSLDPTFLLSFPLLLNNLWAEGHWKQRGQRPWGCLLSSLCPPLSLLPVAPYLSGRNATEIHPPNKWGMAALQDWVLALALKVSKARFYHEFGAKCVLGGLLPMCSCTGVFIGITQLGYSY